MDVKNTREMRRRLSDEYENVRRSVNRNRIATEEITIENTEDEGDLATISHNRELLNNLNESDVVRLRFIDDALKAIDRGQYGQCVSCGEDIKEKRLEAIPWATMCIRCQEQTEIEEST